MGLVGKKYKRRNTSLIDEFLQKKKKSEDEY